MAEIKEARAVGVLRIEMAFTCLSDGERAFYYYDPEPGNMEAHHTLAMAADNDDEARKLFPQLMAKAAKALYDLEHPAAA